MARIPKTTLDSLITDFIEDNGISQKDVEEELLWKWAEDRVKLIKTDEQLKPVIRLIPVSNYKAQRPKDLRTIMEVAALADPGKATPSRSYEIESWVQKTHDDCELELKFNCPECTENDHSNAVSVEVDRLWDISHPELFYEKYLRVGRFGYGKSVHNPEFELLTYSPGSWHSMGAHIPGCANINCPSCHHQYTLESNFISTSFEKGILLISYLAEDLDENGYLMVPDDPLVFEAVLQYLTYKWFRREFLRTSDPMYRAVYMEASQRMDVDLARARSKLQIPSIKDFWSWVRKNKNYRVDRAYDNKLKGRFAGQRGSRRFRDIFK